MQSQQNILTTEYTELDASKLCEKEQHSHERYRPHLFKRHGRPGGSPVVEKETQSHKGAEIFSVYSLYSVVKIPVEYPRLQIPIILLRLQRAQSFFADTR